MSLIGVTGQAKVCDITLIIVALTAKRTTEIANGLFSLMLLRLMALVLRNLTPKLTCAQWLARGLANARPRDRQPGDNVQ